MNSSLPPVQGFVPGPFSVREFKEPVSTKFTSEKRATPRVPPNSPVSCHKDSFPPIVRRGCVVPRSSKFKDGVFSIEGVSKFCSLKIRKLLDSRAHIKEVKLTLNLSSLDLRLIEKKLKRLMEALNSDTQYPPVLLSISLSAFSLFEVTTLGFIDPDTNEPFKFLQYVTSLVVSDDENSDWPDLLDSGNIDAFYASLKCFPSLGKLLLSSVKVEEGIAFRAPDTVNEFSISTSLESLCGED